MAVKKVDISLSGGLDLFFTHYNYWLNWKNSTALVDVGYNIIAFNNHNTREIDFIHLVWIQHKGWWIIKDWVWIEVEWLIKIKNTWVNDDNISLLDNII